MNLTFGVQLTNYLRYRYSIAEPSEASVDEFDAMVSSLYARTKLYSKFLRLRAVDASRPERELWKVQVVKEDTAEVTGVKITLSKEWKNRETDVRYALRAAGESRAQIEYTEES